MNCKFFLLLAPILFSGCVATQYEKSVTVTKDANGKILGIVETERIIQPNQQGWPVKFDYLKGIQVGEKN